MRFTNSDRQLGEEEISRIELELGLSFPPPLRQFYATQNGGSPAPYVLERFLLHTVVSEALPLISEQDRCTAIGSYRLLVRQREIVPSHFFPFAVDGGGDYFFVDCNGADAPVYFYRSDGGGERDPLMTLGLTLAEFWDALEPEE